VDVDNELYSSDKIIKIYNATMTKYNINTNDEKHYNASKLLVAILRVEIASAIRSECKGQ